MKKNKKYYGVIVPMLTPLDENLKIDVLSLEKMLDTYIRDKNFPFVLGTTGEIASNSFENRETLVKNAGRYINGRTTFYAGVTDNCVENTIETTKRYSGYGVDAMVVHLPYFFPLTEGLILNYFEYVADNSPSPIIIYNIKSITRTSISVEIIEKLSSHDNIVGLKDSDRDIKRVEILADKFRNREDFSLFIGWTNKSSEALKLGFDGIIPNTANVVPSLFERLYNSAILGNHEEALKIQGRAEMLSELVQNNRTMTRTIPELKAIMNHLGLCKPFVLPPLEKLKDDEADILVKEFIRLDL
ncbi:dihydrodipicolinate synthase family protein [Bacteroidota bacterium]